MDTNIISSIISGSASLTSSFLNFGQSIYATNHMQAPPADNFTYNIQLPETQSTGILSPTLIFSIAAVFMIVVLFLVILYKKM